MLDIGWSEMAVIALVALIVIGPKELPHAMRAAAKWIRKARSLAREFQSGIDDMVREADLEDARKTIESTRNLDLEKTIEDTVDPTGTVREEAGELERTAHGTEDETPAPAARSGKSEAPARDAGPSGSASETGQADDSAGAATVVKHPVQLAPAHSVTPPAEEAEQPASAAGETGSGEDGTQKRA